jgi:GT2 family glycosyltransferase
MPRPHRVCRGVDEVAVCSMSSADGRRSLSVVIPVRDGAATIAEQLEALAGQAADCVEIVVVDNGSVDETLVVVQKFMDRIPNLRIVDGAGVIGLCNVRSYAAESAVGDLACCDADDVVAPGWIRAMSAALDDYDIVGGTIEEGLLNPPGARPRTGQGTDLPMGCGYLPFATGANCAVRREVIDHLGGWSPRYVRSGEDVDFSWRAQLAGYRIGFAPAAVVHYRHRRSGSATRRQNIGYGYAHAVLHSDFRSRGLKRGSVLQVLLPWAKVAARVPIALVRPERRLGWQAAVGFSWGKVIGMFAERAWPYSCP